MCMEGRNRGSLQQFGFFKNFINCNNIKEKEEKKEKKNKTIKTAKRRKKLTHLREKGRGEGEETNEEKKKVTIEKAVVSLQQARYCVQGREWREAKNGGGGGYQC